jgi:uncharacterized repeat protein (TIGR03803 family)
MRLGKHYFPPITLLLLTVLMTVTPAAAQTVPPREKILASFTGKGSGGWPNGALISDAAGNFYGVTYHGGIPVSTLGLGTVFEMSPTAEGGWTTKLIYRFQLGADGHWPVGGLVMDSSGNLYGMTQGGGTNLCQDGYDLFSCGTVFELSPNGSGGWSEKIIYNFSEKDGFYPQWGLILDSAGNLYGTTAFGGSKQNENKGVGTVFELRPSGEGWTYRVLHSFHSGTTDGWVPSGPLVSDAAGNLYGETLFGGQAAIGFQSGNGIIFGLIHTASGWKEEILFDFGSDSSGASGVAPNGGLIFDSAGNLYGTTFYGGIGYGFGTVFELTPTNGGAWNETVLYSFLSNGDNAANPAAGSVMDSAGNLYGTTSWGGSAYRSGTVFELKPSANGAWTYVGLYSFGSYATDGYQPNSSLLFDSKGSLYGTTNGGGTGGYGTVFEITP